MPENPSLSIANNIGVIVLAAGASRRMGTPKQLLRVSGNSLIRRAAQTALESNCKPVVIVLGANLDLIEPELADLILKIAVNEQWDSGVSSSIRCGLKKAMEETPKLSGVILMLADQPFLTAESLQQLIAVHMEMPANIVAAQYPNGFGTPALFPKKYFEELLQLEGKAGAKNLLHRHESELIAVAIPQIEFDLDTPDAVLDFRKNLASSKF